MAVGVGRTEVQDSEDELLLSSPSTVLVHDADKLCAAARVPSQERQDALYEVACSAQDAANAPLHKAEPLDADPKNASNNDAASQNGRIDMHTNMTDLDPSIVKETLGASPPVQALLGEHRQPTQDSPASHPLSPPSKLSNQSSTFSSADPKTRANIDESPTNVESSVRQEHRTGGVVCTVVPSDDTSDEQSSDVNGNMQLQPGKDKHVTSAEQDPHGSEKVSVQEHDSGMANVMHPHVKSTPTTQELHAPDRVLVHRSPQEVTLAELKAQKNVLIAALSTLPAIQVLVEENSILNPSVNEVDDGPSEGEVMAAASKITKDHIKLLHEYNELKDIGQGLMGLIADQRGVRIIEVQEEFGIDARD